MDPKLVEMHRKLFGNKLQKKLILDERGGVVFNPGIYRSEDGKYYLYARTSTHHVNYTSWIRLYESEDGINFRKTKEFFLYPPYTIKEYIYGFEDDRCSKINEWWVHTHSTLLANDTESPSRKNFTDYIGVSLGKKADEAYFVGIVDIPDDKNSALVGDRPWLIHRPVTWGKPPCIWYGDFSEGFKQAQALYPKAKENELPYERLIRITPPKNNRILLAPLDEWGVYKIGLGAQPIYIGNSRYLFTVHVRSIPYQYWVTAGILKIKDEPKIEKLLPIPLCIPDTPWEIIGDVPKVCFICGVTLADGKVEGWYGAADTRIMKFEIDLDYLLSVIEEYGITEERINENIEKYVKENRDKLINNELIDQEWLHTILQ